MKLLLTVFIFLLSISSFGQNDFIIHGKISLLSKSTSIIVSSSSGQFTSPIASDGSFEIKGTLEEPGGSLIKTDSSGADGIWLQPGEYTIQCKEITMSGIKGTLFRIPELKGPKDAEINHGFMQTLYYLGGKSREETRKNYTDFCRRYLDSVVRFYPKSRTIPQIISFSQPYIGDEAVQYYLSILDKDLKTEQYSNGLDNYFKRKEKIEKEKYFTDFKMKDKDGKLFKMSSVNKKLILVDFWSSDCIPCRHKHIKLVELYKKYADKGLEIVSISLDDNKEQWQKAIAKDNMTWINVSELKGWETTLAEYYFIKSIPIGFWLDKDKKIITTESLSEKQMEEYLK